MTRSMKRIRKIASHRIVWPDLSEQTLSVVEILSGVVSRCYPLTAEQPMTEWLPGKLNLRYDEAGQLRAYYEGKLLE